MRRSPGDPDPIRATARTLRTLIIDINREDRAQSAQDPEAYLARLGQERWRKLPRQIAYCFEQSAYFRERFQAAGVKDPRDVDSLEAFRRLPVMMDKASHRESQQLSLATAGHPFGVHLCAPLESVIHVAATSGTTGEPTFYTFTRKDLDITCQVFGRLFAKAGIRPGDTVLHAFGLSLWLAGITIVQSLEAYGARPIAIGAEAGIARILRTAQLVRPRVLMATPSLVNHLIERAPGEIGCEVADLGIEVLFCAGEPGIGIPSFRQRLRDAYGAQVYDATGGAWHNGTVSCDSDQYHGMHQLAEDYCFRYDLVDPQTRQPIELKDGAVGEAIHTALEYEAGPAFRNATGDMVEIRVGECPGCGEFGTRMLILGRTDDVLNIKGVKVYPQAVRALVARFGPEVSGQIQIVLPSPPPRVEPPLDLRVELAPHAANLDRHALAKRLEERIHQVLAIRARVNLVAFGSLARSNLKTKLLLIEPATAKP